MAVNYMLRFFAIFVQQNKHVHHVSLKQQPAPKPRWQLPGREVCYNKLPPVFDSTIRTPVKEGHLTSTPCLPVSKQNITMAKAITVVLLLAATAAFVAAHPSMGKGYNMAMNATAYSGSNAAKTIGFSHGGTDLSKCDCKEECTDNTRKVCKEKQKKEQVCKEEKGEEDIVVCETKCFKADKVISIGKGRRLLSANGMATIPKVAKAAIMAHAANGTDAQGSGGKICREICKDAKKPTKKEVCKEEKKTVYEDCKEQVLSTRCVKNCKCGDKTITITPGGHNIHTLATALLHHGH